MIHDKYFSYALPMVHEMRNMSEAEFVRLLLSRQAQGDNEFTLDLYNLANGKDYNLEALQTNFTLAHSFMAQSFDEERNVYVMEEELTNALSSSSIKIPVSEIVPPVNSFMLYHGLSYENLGYEAFKHHLIECSHVHIVRLKDCTHIMIADLIKNLKDAHSNDPQRRQLCYENTGYSSLMLPHEETYEKSIVLDSRRTEMNDKGYVGQDPTLNNIEFKKAFLDVRDRITHVVIALCSYLEMEQDIEIVKPEWTREMVDKISNPKKRRRAEKKLAQEASYAVHYVGKKYQREVQNKLASAGLPRSYKYQIKVPGHFNYYWYGKRKDKNGNRVRGEVRKPKWLEPLIRLPELPEAPEKGHLYKVR